MTEPTAKTMVTSGDKQDSPVRAPIEQNSKKDVKKSQSSKNRPDNAMVVPDKAALLALFKLPVSQSAKTVLSSDAPSVQSAFPQLSAEQGTNTATDTTVAAQRVALYHAQHERTRLLYMATSSTRPTYLVKALKSQFREYQHHQLAEQLDKRGLLSIESLEQLWQQLHIVDDIIADIVRRMPAQQPAGWQIVIQDGHNPLCFATVGPLKHRIPLLDQASLNTYVLGHFGVSSFTYDRGYYIGHVVGYLFCCYFCAHLSISYGVTALDPHVIEDYSYASLETPYMVRLLQGLDSYCKKRIYQLAVICARLSVYASNKRIEKMLIAEVNDFDKKRQQQHLEVLLSQGIMPDDDDTVPFF